MLCESVYLLMEIKENIVKAHGKHYGTKTFVFVSCFNVRKVTADDEERLSHVIHGCHRLLTCSVSVLSTSLKLF